MRIRKKFKQYFKKKNLSTMNNRKKVGIILFTTSIGLFFLFAARLSYIVIVGQVAGTSLEEKTKALYQGSQVIQAKRGAIYDRNGIVIAEDATSYSLYAILDESYVSQGKNLYAEVGNFEALAKIIETALDGKVKQATVLNTLKNGDENELYQVDIPNGKSITLQEKQAIEAAMEEQDIAGLYFTEHPSRIYPNGVFSSHLIGYADIQENEETGQEELVGMMGIEAVYDDILSGQDGKVTFQKDNFQNPLAGTTDEIEPAEDGQDIYTTLDSRLQTYLEQLMDEAWEKTEAQDLTAVLMDAKTGEIISMAQRPTFNPESKEEGFSEDDFIWQNLFVQDNYEPGSTMKVLTQAAAIDTGVYDPDEVYSTSELVLADATIKDWDLGVTHPTLAMRHALSWSSNIGMVTLEQKMPERWQQYLREFGFGQSTYSGLTEEVKGNLPEDNLVSKAMSSFGQAIGVSQLQMLQAFTAISNDGTMVRPQFVKKIVNSSTNEQIVTQTQVVGQPITAEAAQTVREYMRETVEDPNYGTAYGYYSLDGVNVAVKTGTAEIAQDGNYLESDYLHSVVTMFPAEDPKYVLYITIKRPEDGNTEALKSISTDLMKRAMDLYNVEPEEVAEESTEKITVQDYREMATTSAAEDARKSGLAVLVIGDGDKIVSQSIKQSRKASSSECLILLTNGKERYMPDFTGWSKDEIMSFGELLDITVNFEGEGYCVDQSVSPFELLEENELTFTLQ